jgi:PmbA protein
VVDLASLQHKLTALADSAVKQARAKGADEAEAFVESEDLITIIIKKAMIEARQGAPSGVGLRVVVDGKLGFAATSGTGDAQIKKVAAEAVAVARIRPLDPDFKHLPDPVKRPSRNGTVDDRLVEFSEKDALKEVNILAKTTLERHKQIKSLEGYVGVGRGAYAVANSRGIAAATKASYINSGIYCVAVENGKQKTGSEFLVSRELDDLSETGTKAADRAVKMLGAKPLGTSLRTTTVWENKAIGALLGNMLKAAASARNVQEGKSYFKGKSGDKVASDILTIIDDGQLPEGLWTQKIDGEGVPMQTTPLIEKGVLKTYLYDSYAAFREERASSGNAKREVPEPFLEHQLCQPPISWSARVGRNWRN